MSEPREKTTDEIRAEVLRYVRDISDYWLNLPGKTPKERVDGAMFSFLAMLDGEAGALPGFVVAPHGHEDDKEYLRKNGENWYPRVESEHDIAGSLHERMIR